ncbi:MAG: response regulator transcription factor [Chloroflexota bacterium]
MPYQDGLRLNAPSEVQRILVVDDNPQTLTLVERILEKVGFEVWCASSGPEALNCIERRGLPHLAIVDFLMPGMNGFELCQRLHEFSELPIVMLTAIAEEENVVVALEHFAEDYIVKPFSPGELVARVERVLRRLGDYHYTRDPMARVDKHLAVDFPGRQAIVDGQPVPLTPTETKLLFILMRNGGRIVPIESLLSRLWPLEPAQEDRLRVHVSRLRRKIEPQPASPNYILSERGTGYSFHSSS